MSQPKLTMDEIAALRAINSTDWHSQPMTPQMRSAIRSLLSAGLVQPADDPTDPWDVRITSQGRDWLRVYGVR